MYFDLNTILTIIIIVFSLTIFFVMWSASSKVNDLTSLFPTENFGVKTTVNGVDFRKAPTTNIVSQTRTRPDEFLLE